MFVTVPFPWIICVPKALSVPWKHLSEGPSCDEYSTLNTIRKNNRVCWFWLVWS